MMEKTAMNLNYRKATLKDIDLLTKSRIEVLRAANGLSDDADMTEVKHQSYEYYRKALHDSTHTAYLVFNSDRFAGAGGISYYQVMPTFRNPSGNKAYIMNIYTRPEYRRQGIARRMLDILIKDAKARGISFITLEATPMGRPLYEKAGFVPLNDEMILPE
jgi:ribosomal protein S18 acetylase RimI-like enzyme